MKKFLCLFMTVSIMAVMLGGCGGKSSKKNGKETETESTETTSVTEETSSVTSMSTMSPAEMSSRSEASSKAAIAKAVEEARKNISSTASSGNITSATNSGGSAGTAASSKASVKSTAAKTTAKTSAASTKFLVDPVEFKFANPIGRLTKGWVVRKFDGLYIRISRVELNDKVTRNFSSSVNSQIVNPRSVTYNPACSVAVIDCNSPTQLKVSTGKGESRGVEDWAKSVDAVIAINGTAAKHGYQEKDSAVIRNGSLFKSYTGSEPIKADHAVCQRLIMYKDGRWENKALDNSAARAAIADGAYNTVRHQGLIIWNGKTVADTSGDTVYRNHTYLGQINAKKYVMMTTEFMAVKDAAAVLNAYGCTKAVQVNGGNCTQMYVKEIGNTTGSSGTSIIGLNKVGYLETEWLAKYGMLAPKKGGGPCTDKLDVIYFK